MLWAKDQINEVPDPTVFNTTFELDEAEIWFCEGALPRTDEKRPPVVRAVWVGQSAFHSSETAAGNRVIGGFSCRQLAKAINARE